MESKVGYSGLRWYDKVAQFFRWENTRHWLATAALAALVLLTTEGYRTMRAIRLQAEQNQYAQDIKEAASSIKDAASELSPLLQAGTGELVEARQMTKSANQQLIAIGNATTRQINGLGELRTEIQHQIQQNGNALAGDLKSLQDFIIHQDSETTALLAQGTLLIKTSNVKTAKLLDDFDIVVKGPNGLEGLVTKGNQSLEQVTGILTDTHKTTSLLYNKLDKQLNPPPCKGIGCWLKKYILRPIRTVAGTAYVVERIFEGLN